MQAHILLTKFSAFLPLEVGSLEVHQVCHVVPSRGLDFAHLTNHSVLLQLSLTILNTTRYGAGEMWRYGEIDITTLSLHALYSIVTALKNGIL